MLIQVDAKQDVLLEKELLVLLLSLGQGCDSCKCDVFCTSFAIESHSSLVKSCQPGEHGCECAALPGILGNACYGCQLRQPLCTELKCIQNSLGAPSSADTTKKHNFCPSSVLRCTPCPSWSARCNPYLP